MNNNNLSLIARASDSIAASKDLGEFFEGAVFGFDEEEVDAAIGLLVGVRM